MVIKMTEEKIIDEEQVVSPVPVYEDEPAEIPVAPSPVYLEDPRYFFWLLDDGRVYATMIAMTESDIKSANDNKMVEVDSAVFFKATSTSVYKDGVLTETVPVYNEPVKKFFFELDSDKYIIGYHIALGEQAVDAAKDKGFIEVSEEVYSKAGKDYRYVSGKLVQGAERPVVLPPESVASIVKSLTATATEQIAILTDATDPDLVDVVDPADVEKLKAWKRYRIALTKIDANNPVFPEQPA